MQRLRSGFPFLACLLLLSVGVHLQAAVYAGKQVTYQQPDGSTFEVRLWGDEFSVNTETLDGWAVLMDANRWWTYAQPDGNGGIVASGVRVGLGDPTTLKITKHLRQSQAQTTTTRATMRTLLRTNRAAGGLLAAPLAAPPTTTTTGTRNGVTIMIRFPDRPSDVTFNASDVDAFCNGSSYSAYGNNGSVKAYYADVSNGALTYTNTVYSSYITASQNRSYYADPDIDFGIRVAELVTEALNALDTAGFGFGSCDVNNDGFVDAVNVFYAGTCPNTWSLGLWPHMNPNFTWTSTGGKRVKGYQISDMTASLSIGTFCHESGHLLCGFPDLYDYGYDSTGGAGDFCLMSSGASGDAKEKNPSRVCAYLALKAGWRTPTNLTSASTGTLSLTAATPSIYRFPKVGSTTEYFLMECRNQSGRDALIPSSGIAIWHVDELGNRDNQSYQDNTTHLNYECALVQADNRRDFENYVNLGDAYDLWFLGNSRSAASFADSMPYNSSANDARWWDGSASGFGLINFSSPGTTMTVDLLASSVAVVDTAVSVSEGDSGTTTANITLRRSGSSAGTASVAWSLADGTARAAGLDYIKASGTAAWASGETGDKTVAVSVLGDTRRESSETFTLQISNPSAAIVLGATTTSTITIVDDDAAPGTAGSIEFATNLVSVTESATTVQLTAKRLSRSAAIAVSVPWTITGGTATSGVDYTAAASGTLSWGATDDADKTISITVIQDPAYESDETIIVQLGAPSVPQATVPFPDTCTLTIVNDDDIVTLPTTIVSAIEPASAPGTAQIPVSRQGALLGAISLEYRTIAGGTGVDGVDFTAVASGTLNWAAGDSAMKFASVPILPDGVADGTKTVLVEFRNPVGCVLDGPSMATLSIYESQSSGGQDATGTASSSGIGGSCGAGALGIVIGLGLIPFLRRRR